MTGAVLQPLGVLRLLLPPGRRALGGGSGLATELGESTEIQRAAGWFTVTKAAFGSV